MRSSVQVRFPPQSRRSFPPNIKRGFLIPANPSARVCVAITFNFKVFIIKFPFLKITLLLFIRLICIHVFQRKSIAVRALFFHRISESRRCEASLDYLRNIVNQVCVLPPPSVVAFGRWRFFYISNSLPRLENRRAPTLGESPTLTRRARLQEERWHGA